MIRFVKISLIVSMLFLNRSLYGQQYSYGLPYSDYYSKETIIIASIPTSARGRFYPSESLEALYSFVKEHDSLDFRIEINFFLFGEKDQLGNQRYSEKLAKELGGGMEEQSITNCSIIANGSSKPIFTDSDMDKRLFEVLNTRMEIYSEQSDQD